MAAGGAISGLFVMMSNASIPHKQAARFLLMAIWFGVLTGLGEVSIVAFRKFYQGQIIYVGPHIAWMAPAADACLFAILGLPLSLVAWRLPRIASLPQVGFFFAFLGCLSLLVMFRSLHVYAAVILALGVAVQAGHLIAVKPELFSRLVRSTAGGLGGVVAALAVGIYGWQWNGERLRVAQLPPVRPDSPNVLLIVLDTVRASNLSLYGYERSTTPNLERLAKTGVVFDRALATAPWTLPSHGSMFTGRLPHELFTGSSQQLAGTYPTLAEVLSSHGYLTAGVAANFWYCTYEFNFDRGFAHYEDYQPSAEELIRSSSLIRRIVKTNVFRQISGFHDILGRKTAPEINESFLQRLTHTDGRPFFAFLNYMDAHDPYLPPQPFSTRFGPEFPWRNPSIIEEWRLSRHKWGHSKVKISWLEAQAELDAYDSSIAYLDHHLGLLFDELDRRGYLQNTLVIITSDHGEQFGEHGRFQHYNSVYRQLLDVPLIMSFPSRVPKGRRVYSPVSLRDIPATIMDLIRLEGRFAFSGSSLARYWSGLPPSIQSGEAIFSEISRREAKSLVAHGMHYIKNADGREELYDFDNDPLEVHDLSDSEEGRRILVNFRSLLEQIGGRVNLIKPEA